MDIQLCIVHVVSNSLRFVSWKDYKAVTSNLKSIYPASTEDNALLRARSILRAMEPSISENRRNQEDQVQKFA